jgi:hypothetical protein
VAYSFLSIIGVTAEGGPTGANTKWQSVHKHLQDCEAVGIGRRVHLNPKHTFLQFIVVVESIPKEALLLLLSHL